MVGGNAMKRLLRNSGLLLALLIMGVLGFIGSLNASGDIVETTVEDQTGLAITVYNDGTGLVKDTRNIDLPSGEFQLKFMDVSSSIDPTSVKLVSNTNPDSITVLEQNYAYDLVSSAAIYEKHIDNKITVRTKDGETVQGTLLGYETAQPEYNDYYYDDSYGSYGSNYNYGYNSGYGYDYGYNYYPERTVYIPPPPALNTGAVEKLIIHTATGIEVITDFSEVMFEALPEGLITRPTLNWNLANESPGIHECEMSYLTSGISWRANYVAVVNQNDNKLDLSGWVTIDNTSGASFIEAVLKLVAGEVHRVQPETVEYKYPRNGWVMLEMEEAAPGFVEESFFEYHLYTLQRPATVLNNQQKQISLLEGEGIDVKKIFVFNPPQTYYSIGDTTEGKINVRLKFENSEENGLGIPIPKGILRVYKEDSSGSLQFIGEDNIDHTPKDEEIDVYLGEAFDIVGERAVMDRRLYKGNIYEYDVKVTIRNHKTTPIEVMYWDYVWGDWEVVTSTLPYNKKDASTVEFAIPVAVDGETVLEYTIRR